MKDSAIVAPVAKRRRSASTGYVDGKGFALDPPFGIVIRLRRSGLNPDFLRLKRPEIAPFKNTACSDFVIERKIILEFSPFFFNIFHFFRRYSNNAIVYI